MRKLLVLVCVALSGCALGPQYQRPVVAIPPRFTTPPGAARQGVEARWWETFQDPQLNQLISKAAAGNFDVEAASARVAQARANVGVSRAALAPDVQAGASTVRERQRFFTGLSASGSPVLRAIGTADFQANFDTSWEIDLWGRVRAGVRAARADLAAQVQDRRDVTVSLLAEVARNYAELRGSQLRLAIAKRNQEDERQLVELTQVLAKAGLDTERDVAQAKSVLSATSASLPPLQASVLVAIHRLSVLTGQEPNSLYEQLALPGKALAGPENFGAGLPSELLERRPDIRKAEEQLLAATARIGIAKADYFPKLMLKASAGRDAASLHDLSLGAANIFSVGPSVSVPVFNFGRIKSNVALEDARTQESAANYRKTVLTALEEVENALAQHARERERLVELQDEAASNRLALELSEVQFKAGLTDFLTVLTAERDVQQTEDLVAQSQIAVSTDLIALYKALGGGWELLPR